MHKSVSPQRRQVQHPRQHHHTQKQTLSSQHLQYTALPSTGLPALELHLKCLTHHDHTRAPPVPGSPACRLEYPFPLQPALPVYPGEERVQVGHRPPVVHLVAGCQVGRVQQQVLGSRLATLLGRAAVAAWEAAGCGCVWGSHVFGPPGAGKPGTTRTAPFGKPGTRTAPLWLLAWAAQGLGPEAGELAGGLALWAGQRQGLRGRAAWPL